jgi:hypothetical protein
LSPGPFNKFVNTWPSISKPTAKAPHDHSGTIP